jgi:hypothetical protein
MKIGSSGWYQSFIFPVKKIDKLPQSLIDFLTPAKAPELTQKTVNKLAYPKTDT